MDETGSHLRAAEMTPTTSPDDNDATSTSTKTAFDEESFFAVLVMICVVAGVIINSVCLVRIKNLQLLGADGVKEAII